MMAKFITTNVPFYIRQQRTIAHTEWIIYNNKYAITSCPLIVYRLVIIKSYCPLSTWVCVCIRVYVAEWQCVGIQLEK